LYADHAILANECMLFDELLFWFEFIYIYFKFSHPTINNYKCKKKDLKNNKKILGSAEKARKKGVISFKKTMLT